jgi:hypothetical protein
MNKYKTIFRVGKKFAFYISILSINLFLSSCSEKLTDKELFELYVLNPMPNSVKDLCIYFSKSITEARGSFYFRISPNDFEKLRASKDFKLSESSDFEITIPEELSKYTNLEVYCYNDNKRFRIYKFVTNKTHDLCFYYYLKY